MFAGKWNRVVITNAFNLFGRQRDIFFPTQVASSITFEVIVSRLIFRLHFKKAFRPCVH